MTRSMVLSRTRILALALAAALLALVALQLVGPRPSTTNVHAATVGLEHISMKVTNSATGVAFKGDDFIIARFAGRINLLAYSYRLNGQYGLANGLPTGRRQHFPVIVTHQLGGSSPQFLAAISQNARLKVVIDFYRISPAGIDQNFYRVTLIDAHVNDVSQHLSGAVVLEDVSFTFRIIQQAQLQVGTNFQDSWLTPLG